VISATSVVGAIGFEPTTPSLEEDRGHVSRIAGRRDRARADEARLALRKSCHFNDVASANAKLQDVLVLSTALVGMTRPLSRDADPSPCASPKETGIDRATCGPSAVTRSS
jgi:hypothetical protein